MSLLATGNTVLLLVVMMTITVTVIKSITIRPVIVPEDVIQYGTCLSQDEREAVLHRISATVSTMLTDHDKNLECGPGLWYQVAQLNMSDPSQDCPSAWRIDNNNCGIRTCRRPPQNSTGSCSSTFYTTDREYSMVCGRAIGYQIGSTDAFGYRAQGEPLDSYYVYGVSITHGMPRNHMWTLAAGVSEGGYGVQSTNCPCSNLSHPGNVLPPSFVGENYYCESANPRNTYSDGHFYCDDPLWDGQQCEGQCCSNGQSPPWFSVELSNPTNDDIEVRMCSPQADDVAIELLEIYIQ